MLVCRHNEFLNMFMDSVYISVICLLSPFFTYSPICKYSLYLARKLCIINCQVFQLDALSAPPAPNHSQNAEHTVHY